MGLEQADILIVQAQSLRSKDVKQALSMLDEALLLSQKNDYKAGIALAIRDKAYCHLEQQDYKRALTGFTESAAFFKELNEIGNQIVCHTEISAIYFKLGDCPSSLHHVLENLKLFTCLSDSHGIAGCYNRIGNIYCYLNDYTQAVD